jgi:PAS domain S-box-containing protein
VLTVRALPRARADRLALRFAALSFVAFACVGAVIHFAIVGDAAAGDRVRIDLALGGGLVGLYVLVLPLALRTARMLRDQSVRIEGQTRQMSAMVDQMPALLWSTDTELRLTESAGSGLRNIGLRPNEHQGLHLSEVFGTDDSALPVIEAHRKALDGEIASYETELGGRAFQACVQPLRSGHEVIGVVGAAFDITERKVAETSLDRLQRQHALILESAGEGIVGVGIRGNATFVNRAAADMLGWEPHEILGRNVHAVFHHSHADGSPSDSESCPTMLVLGDGEVRQSAGDVFWKRDGSSFFVDYVSAPLRDGGRVIGAVLVFRDVTQRRLAEEELQTNFRLLRKSHEDRRRLVAQLVHAEEEERRRIAGDIHDDSLQLMAAVSMHLFNVRRHLSDPEEEGALEALEESVREAIGRLRHLLFELRPPTLDREGLSAALRLLLEQTFDPEITWIVEDRISSEPPSEARTILYRIAQEALANVRKHAFAAHVGVTIDEQGGGYVVRISDDGRGFDAEMLRPRPGHLGVAAMRERAEVTGGWFRIESAPGEGSMVECWVPVEESAAVGAP